MVTADIQPTPPTESVLRPDPGLARGRYEAPSWAFMAVAAAALLGLAFVVGRAGRAWWVRSRPAPSSRRKGRF